MNEPQAKRMQIFIGGAFSVIGFRALFWLPHNLMTNIGWVGQISLCFFSFFWILFLPLGIGMLGGNSQIMRWAQIYLWLNVVFYGIYLVAPILTMFLLHKEMFVNWWNALFNFLQVAILLGLLSWSQNSHDKNI